MNYSKGKIYKIIDLTNDDIYIGSTIQTLKQRWSDHQIFREYDKKRKDCKIFLVEDYPCESNEELTEREQYYLDNTECINKNRAHRDEEHIRLDNIKRSLKYHYKKMNDEQYRKKNVNYQKEHRRYQMTWGDRIDYPNPCNLLFIDPYLFLV